MIASTYRGRREANNRDPGGIREKKIDSWMESKKKVV